MRQVGHRQYGGAETLTVRDVPTPEPGPGEVRIRVHGAIPTALQKWIAGDRNACLPEGTWGMRVCHGARCGPGP